MCPDELPNGIIDRVFVEDRVEGGGWSCQEVDHMLTSLMTVLEIDGVCVAGWPITTEDWIRIQVHRMKDDPEKWLRLMIDKTQMDLNNTLDIMEEKRNEHQQD